MRLTPNTLALIFGTIFVACLIGAVLSYQAILSIGAGH